MTGERINLLLIEDDEIDRELVRRLIGQTYELHEATNGSDGLATLANQRPQLVLLDYRLPDIDSFDLLDQLVADDIPVIILTGEENPEVIVTAMRKGAEDYLLKTNLSRDTLEWAVHGALEKAQLQRSVKEQQQQLHRQAQQLAERNQQIRALASALTLAEQRERKRIAQILHDYVQQLLYGVQMRLHLLTQDLPQDGTTTMQNDLETATGLVEDAIASTRSLAVDISPPVLKDDGVGVALQWLATQMEQIHSLHVDLQIVADYRVQQEELHILIFQLVRELLFNVVKHANVQEARVRLFDENGQYKITVEDEGIGFDANQVVQPKWKPEQGYGLYSVRERLALFGGQLYVDSHPGNGARVTIILPDALTAS